MKIKDIPNDSYRLDIEEQINDALDFINKYHLAYHYPVLFVQDSKDGLPFKVWGIRLQTLIDEKDWTPETEVDLLYDREDENG